MKFARNVNALRGCPVSDVRGVGLTWDTRNIAGIEKSYFKKKRDGTVAPPLVFSLSLAESTAAAFFNCLVGVLSLFFS